MLCLEQVILTPKRHDPWRGLSRTSFGLDYLKYYRCPEAPADNNESSMDKMMELNCYDKDDNPRYGGISVHVQRISCYIQHKETVQEMSQYEDIANPYQEVKNENNTHTYVPDLGSLDNGNTIIIFENSQSGSIEDTLITARQQWESKWRRLPFYLAYESHDVSNDDNMALECMKIVLQDVWKSITEEWEDFLDVSNTHVSILEDKIYEYVILKAMSSALVQTQSFGTLIETSSSFDVSGLDLSH